MKTVAVSALGCKVNQYEAQAMREQFARAGYRLVGRDAAADVYVINTCTVTGSADAKSRRLIRNALRANPAARVVVTGCYAELDRREIEALSPHLVVVGNEEKNGIAQLLAPKGASVLPSGAGRITAFSGRARAFVKVQDGCDNFCSYCKVPLARGRSRSRPSDEITAEIRTLVANGYKEIVLTGICLGDWGRDLGVAFELLLHESAAAAGGARIRLSSIEPWYVTDAILRVMASSRVFCRHLHIPLQSGDDDILRRMKRKMTAGLFSRLVARSREVMPAVAFSTDIIVGFPGETERQFENTLTLVEATRPAKAHIFPFSLRQGTAAEAFSGECLSDAVVRSRVARLRALTDGFERAYRASLAGERVTLLIEMQRERKTGMLTGLTDTYIKVLCQGDDTLKGSLVEATLTHSTAPLQLRLPSDSA